MFDRLEGNVWMDGALRPWAEACVHVMTHGLHYGTCVFEGIRSYGDVLFQAEDHFKRFFQSAELLDFRIPYTQDDLIKGAQQVIETTAYPQGYVRALAWCGSKSMTVSHQHADVRVAIGVWNRAMPYPQEIYEKGLRLHVTSWRRPDPRTAPVHSKAAGLYMISAMAKRTAELQGFEDALLLDTHDNMAEATSSNIFFVEKEKVITPYPHSFLKGITRKTCMELAQKEGFVVEEKDVKLKDLSLMTEAFLTGTAVGVVPIASIQEQDGKLWTSSGHTVTRQIQKRFQAFLDEGIKNLAI